MYCNYMLTTKVTALQVVRTSFQLHSFISGLPRQSLLLSLTSHGIDPEYMSIIMCNLRELNFLLCALEKYCFWYQELQTANGIKKLVSVMLKLHMQTWSKVQTIYSCKMQNEDCRLGLKF